MLKGPFTGLGQRIFSTITRSQRYYQLWTKTHTIAFTCSNLDTVEISNSPLAQNLVNQNGSSESFLSVIHKNTQGRCGHLLAKLGGGHNQVDCYTKANDQEANPATKHKSYQFSTNGQKTLNKYCHIEDFPHQCNYSSQKHEYSLSCQHIHAGGENHHKSISSPGKKTL